MADFKVVDVEGLELELTDIADEVRILTDTAEKMSMAAMADGVAEANGIISVQSGIISDIKTVLSDLDDGISALGEEVKELAGAEEDLNLVTMTEKVSEANERVETQAELISQIKSALQGKAASGDEGFVGIKLLNFENGLPTILDMRDLPVTEAFLSQDNCFANLCYDCGFYKKISEVYIPDGLTVFSTCMFYSTPVATVYGDLTKIKKVHDYAFQRTGLVGQAPYLPNVEFIGYRAFDNNTKLESVYLFNKQASISANAYDRCPKLKDIYVSWSEGEVANAPWGATNATIHYNTQYDADGNPITEQGGDG